VESTNPLIKENNRSGQELELSAEEEESSDEDPFSVDSMAARASQRQQPADRASLQVRGSMKRAAATEGDPRLSRP